MRYHHTTPKHITHFYGEIYHCNHPVYSTCTLYKIGNKGMAVIQQRYDKNTKHTFWTQIDDELVDTIYLNQNFKKFFDSKADLPINNIYPTVSVRQLMWGLKMKPIKRQVWETYFDRKII